MDAYCSQCGARLPSSAAYCPNCRHALNGDVFPRDKAHSVLISVMWLLTFGYFCFLSASSSGMASLCGFPSFVMSIYLITRKNGTDQTNGWVRLGIGIVMGLVYFARATQRA